MNAIGFSHSFVSLFTRSARHAAAISLSAGALALIALPPSANGADIDSNQIAATQFASGTPGCDGDIFPTGGDGIIDQDDFPPFVFAYDLLICGDPPMPVGCPADFSHDGYVDDTDFLIFVHAYNDYFCP